MTEEPKNDQREYERIKDRHRVLAKVCSEEDFLTTNTVTGTTSDISKGGVRFLTHHRLEVGTQLKIHIALHEPLKAISRNCEVVWLDDSNPYNFEVGVAFSGGTDMDGPFWEQYVDRCALHTSM